ncbi:MAG: hypothetical protein NZ959_07580 [Armatimonadetes bacterium]|nr:hypothetical protein [Armatimonadota bacterium]MDW8122408.1 hypothetical protein [Armatimonadota bacterium]
MLKGALVVLLLLMVVVSLSSLSPLPDRFLWIFGWSLNSDTDLDQIRPLLRTSAKNGYNGIVLSAGLDVLCKRDKSFFQRLAQIREDCKRLRLQLIPAVFSVGYGGGILSHNLHLAEGLPVRDALFVVKGDQAHHQADPPVSILNGSFEEFEGNRMKGFAFHDEPSVMSFADTRIYRSGAASLRFENFLAHPYGNARVMQEVKVHPYRCYKVSLWVKTEGLKPKENFQIVALVDDRNLAPKTFPIAETQDWTKLVMLFNSLEFSTIRLYAGLWGGREGRFWLDDWTIEEVGPINVLQRDGTPVTVKSEDGQVVYQEGKDYDRLVDQGFSFWNIDRPSPVIKIRPNGRIREGQKLRVSWFHPMVIHESQVTVCMGEEEVYRIWEHEAELLHKYLSPDAFILNMDEVRMGGTCRRCEGADMAQLLGHCISRQVAILRRHSPKARIYIWSDMLDPNHNARPNYYLVNGDYTGSWNFIPKDLIIAVWGGEPREESLKFFSEQGFSILIACYYDADDLTDVVRWRRLADKYPAVRGFMYTTWVNRYGLVPDFAKVVWGQ